MRHNYETPNLKYCHNLAEQYNFIQEVKEEVLIAMIETQARSAPVVVNQIFVHVPGGLYTINPLLSDIEKRSIQFSAPLTVAPDSHAGNRLMGIQDSQTHSKIRDSLLHHV